MLFTAHRECDKGQEVVLVTGHARPNLLYDYYGFPRPTYNLQHPDSGHPQLAKLVVIVDGEITLQIGSDTSFCSKLVFVRFNLFGRLYLVSPKTRRDKML